MRTFKPLIALVFFLIAQVHAQAQGTTVPFPQMRFGAPGAVEQIKLVGLGLEMVNIRIGPGLKLQLAADGAVELVANPTPVQQLTINHQILTQDQNENYPCSPCQTIYRNGISQTEGRDFDRNSGGILPRPDAQGRRWNKDDIVKAEWIGPAPVSAAAIFPERTVVEFDQIRNWEQLRNPQVKGTSIAFDQIPMPQDIASIWQSQAETPLYDEYRAALVEAQSFPILITCIQKRCDDSWPLWFRSEKEKIKQDGRGGDQ